MKKQHNHKVKIALITGAARRIGAEIARHLHEKGMNVIVHYHTSDAEAKRLYIKLNKQRKNSAVILQADLSVVANLASLIQRAVNVWGQLDVLVNNASVFSKSAAGKVSSADWDILMNTNLKAPYFLSQAALPHLAEQRGCIVNIVDIHGGRPMRDYAVYCVSKAGLQMLTKALARELAPDVRVNSVSPGEVIWPEGKNSLNSKVKQKILERIALSHHGKPADVAKAVWFLVNDADYITGHDLVVDGGRLLFG